MTSGSDDLGVPVEVDLEAILEPPAGAPAESTLAVRIEARPVASADSDPEPIRLDAEAPGQARLGLSPGTTWEIRAESSGWWASPSYVTPRAGAAAVETSIRLVPSAELVGILTPPDDRELPAAATLTFEGSAAGRPVPRTLVDCPIDGLRRFRCVVPRGVLDLRVRVAGYVSHYFWSFEVDARDRSWLAALKLVAGSSVVGWVVDEAGDPLPEGVGLTVTAVPQGMANVPRSPEGGAWEGAASAVSTSPDDRGFFQLIGLSPGAYVLQLEAEGFAATEGPPVAVSEGGESQLLSPVVIHRPLELVVGVDPPRDADGAPWRLTLVDGRRVVPIAAGAGGGEGDWRVGDVAPGSYSIVVEDSGGRRVLNQEIEVAQGADRVLLTIDRVEIVGEVRLGDAPLAAEVAFGGQTGKVSIRMQADEDGRFSGWLPRAGEWRVDVVSRHPRVHRRFAAVEVDENRSGRPSRVRLELPDSLLEGQVVDEAGRPASSAVVVVQGVPFSEMPSSDPVDENGRFRLRGLAPGTYRVQAIGAQGAGGRVHSAPVDVDVAANVPYAELRLVLAPPVMLSGRVSASWGGVPGAKVVAQPREVAPGLLNPTLTRADGSFSVALPAGTRTVDLTIQAPGYVLGLFHGLTVREGRPLELPVESGHGGSLRIAGAAWNWQSSGGTPYVVRFKGQPVGLSLLAEWARLHQQDLAETTLTVPRLPPGEWSVCRPAGPGGGDVSCQEIFLTSGASEEVRFD